MRHIVIALVLLGGVAQAAVESELVRSGMAAYNDLDFQKSIDLLKKALNESLTKEEKVATYKTMAFAHVALGKTADAQTDFENLLQVDPSFQLDRTISPRVRTAFEAAQTKVAVFVGVENKAITPGLRVEAPRQGKYGQPVSLRASYAGGMVQKMELFYRTRGQNKFNRLEVRGTTGVFQATVPGMQVQAPALEYYLTLVDEIGATAAVAGSLGRPLGIDVPAPPKPLYTKGWFWGVIGGVAAAGVVAGVLAATLPNHIGPDSPATLTIKPQ
jgi:hypothetical protein